MFLSQGWAPGGLCLGTMGERVGLHVLCDKTSASYSLSIQSWRDLEGSAWPPRFSYWKLLPTDALFLVPVLGASWPALISAAPARLFPPVS